MQKASARLGLEAVRKSFVFSGRSTRTEVVSYLLLVILFMLGWIAIILLLGLIKGLPEGRMGERLELALEILPMLPLLGLLARRLNDQDRSRRWMLTWLLAVASRLADEASEEEMTLFGYGPEALDHFAGVGLVPLIVLLCLRGVEGSNGYGPDPRTAEA